jgi:hypothetical protein
VVVGGSDHGIVYIFDQKAGTVLQKLHHGRDELVQTIAVHPQDVLMSQGSKLTVTTQTHDLDNDTSIITALLCVGEKEPMVCIWVCH